MFNNNHRAKILLVGKNFKHLDKIAKLIRDSIKQVEIVYISNDNQSDLTDISKSNADAIFYFITGREYEDLTTLKIIKNITETPIVLVSEKQFRHETLKNAINGLENYLIIEDLTPTKFKKIFHSAINYLSPIEYARHYVHI